MGYRQFMWGLSNGIVVLTLSGTFWLGLAAIKWSTVRGPLMASALLIIPSATALFVGAIRIRRKATGFKLSELRNADEFQRSTTKRTVVGFLWINLGQFLGIWVMGYLCYVYQRFDLIWPAIGLVVSLHFLPLGRLFHVPVYYITGVVGIAVCLIAALSPLGASRLLFVGLSMGVVVWVTATYLIRNGDQLAQGAVQDSTVIHGIGQ